MAEAGLRVERPGARELVKGGPREEQMTRST